MPTLVHLIRSDNFEREVVAEKKPVLLLCMHWNEEFSKELEVIEDVAKKYSRELKVGLLQEDFIETFKKNYSLIGTPTFLILVEGKERSRMLGLADQDTLTDFISNSKQAFPR